LPIASMITMRFGRQTPAIARSSRSTWPAGLKLSRL
jgi:hypothetical protein